MDNTASTWALVPLKSTPHAKSRLAGVLSTSQRACLLRTLAERVIRSLLATPTIDAVAVVTASTELATFSRSLGALPLLQSTDSGMSAALEWGLCELELRDTDRVLMVPGDLPLLTPAVLTRFFESAGRGPGIALIPDRRLEGTNLLLCAPPHTVAPCFGEASFARHLAAAASAGIEARVLHFEELALDLDEPDDLRYLRSRHAVQAAELFEALDFSTAGAVVQPSSEVVTL